MTLKDSPIPTSSRTPTQASTSAANCYRDYRSPVLKKMIYEIDPGHGATGPTNRGCLVAHTASIRHRSTPLTGAIYSPPKMEDRLAYMEMGLHVDDAVHPAHLHRSQSFRQTVLCCAVSRRLSALFAAPGESEGDEVRLARRLLPRTCLPLLVEEVQ